MSRHGDETPWVTFYTSDFLAGTSGMTAACKGVYITLLCLIYESEKPLTQRWEILARRCGCTLPAFKRALSDLEDDGKMEVTDAGIWSEKCEKHIARRRERRGSAKAAAKTRWQKTKENQGEDDADAMRTQCHPESQPESESEREGFSLSLERDGDPERGDRASPRKDERPPAPDRPPSSKSPSGEKQKDEDAAFERFWKSYPHRGGVKRGKQPARTKWRAALRSGADAEQIIAAAEAQHGDRRVIDGYARDPATWLNQRGWEDEIEPPRTALSTGGPNGGSAITGAPASPAESPAQRRARERFERRARIAGDLERQFGDADSGTRVDAPYSGQDC